MATTVPSTTDFNSLLGGNVTNPSAKSINEQADRFLKLLVAQVQNQDPLSPMENAEVTSQMAQINTVTGIEKLNSTVEGLSGQFLQMQMLQGANLVGREVVVPGNAVSIDEDSAGGSFELAGSADRVTVEVLSASGQVIETLQLGALEGGANSFSFEHDGDADAQLSFRVTATYGGVAVAATPLMRDQVASVVTREGSLVLQLGRGGSVDYGEVRAVQ